MSDAGASQPDPLLSADEDLPNDPPSPASDAELSPNGDAPGNAGDDSDDESVLSEVDEAQFEDFDAANIAIDDRPALEADEDNLKLIGRHKRKRPAEGEDGARKKKRKEGKREKAKKTRKRGDSEDRFSGGEELEGKRSRKKKDGEKSRSKARAATPEDEEALDPEESTFDITWSNHVSWSNCYRATTCS